MNNDACVLLIGNYLLQILKASTLLKQDDSGSKALSSFDPYEEFLIDNREAHKK